MTHFLWVRNLDLYEQLERQYPELATRATLLATDAAVLWTCQEAQMPFYSLWSLVHLDDQIEAAQEALELAEVWLRDSQVLLYQGVNLGELSRMSLLYTFRDALFARRMAERFFEQVSPASLLLPAGGATGPLSVLEAVLSWEARRRNLPVEDLPVATAVSPVGRIRLLERVRRNLRAILANACLARRRPAHSRGQPTVLFFGGGADFVNQLHLIARLRATRPYHVVHVSLTPPRASAYSRSQQVVPQPALPLLPYTGPAQYLALRALGRRAWQWFRENCLTYRQRYPELFDNPGLEAVFRRFFLHTLSRVGGVLGSAGRLLDFFAPALVVLNNDAAGRERAIVHAARQRGIPTVQLIHSGFNDLHFRRFTTDQMWVWGEAHRRQLVEIGFPAERIRITGNPNYDYLAEVKEAAPRTRTEVRRHLGLTENDLLLVLITAKPLGLLSFVDMEQHTQDLRALCAALDGRPQVRLIIKPHPRYDDLAIYRSLAGRYPWIGVVSDIMLDRLLPAADVALMVNTATTGGLEALLHEKPVVWIRPSTRYPPAFAFFEPAVLTVDRHSEIAPTLERLVNSPEYRQAVTAQGQQALPALAANLDGSATDVVIAAIDQVVQQAMAR